MPPSSLTQPDVQSGQPGRHNDARPVWQWKRARRSQLDFPDGSVSCRWACLKSNYRSVTVTDRIVTCSVGWEFSPLRLFVTGVVPMASTTVIPSVTSPKML